ncbi:glycoside hydrolase family protein [Paenibacillus terrae HPL-003]|uniref:Glycoside hydrolase family protein n=1 Tax=Paenibacillus terrae (strain HPL-003) TaxID=985665 RepID=G7VZI3_PAETH|nr:GH32 C-terminal domain-containing protein [Paenibacillus terrae]AET57225.1 glycoside hydrolase family protein [Paenibacillus terrae HPL-003]
MPTISRWNPNEAELPSVDRLCKRKRGGKTFPYDVELERPLKLLPDQEYELKVFVDGTICEVYVGGEVALSARIYDIQHGKKACTIR